MAPPEGQMTNDEIGMTKEARLATYQGLLFRLKAQSSELFFLFRLKANS